MTRIIRGTVTSKGQITLPKAVRDHLHAAQGTQLEFVLEDGGVTLRPSSADADPLRAWFGVARTPDMQTAQDFTNATRERDGDPPARPNPPGQRIIYLHPDGTESTSGP